MKTIAILSGRFHPFHRGHKKMYDHLVKQFGAGNVFVASSNAQAPLTSPFSFEEKKAMMVATGIPEDKIVQVKNPYAATEITTMFDPETTAVVYGVADKDADRFKFQKKDGSPSYIQRFNSKEPLRPMSANAYAMFVPTVKFSLLGKDIESATKIRALFIRSSDRERDTLLKQMYGSTSPEIKQIFNKKLAIVESAITILMANRHNMLTHEQVPLLESITNKERNIL